MSPRIPGGERGPIQDAAAGWSASARPCPLTGRTSSRPDLPVPWERRCRVWNPRPPFPPTRVGCPRRRYPAFRASEADLTRTGGLARVEYGRPTLRWREPDSNHQSREGAVGAFASTQVNEAIGSIRAYCLPRDDRRASTRALHRGDPYNPHPEATSPSGEPRVDLGPFDRGGGSLARTSDGMAQASSVEPINKSGT